MGFKVDIPRGSHFTLDNIPFGVISTSSDPRPRCATAIGGYSVDLGKFWQDRSSSSHNLQDIFSQPTLNTFATLPTTVRTEVRQQIIAALRNGEVPESCYTPLKDVKMHLPMHIEEYSDFFCSLEHCQNCSPMTGGKISKNFFFAPMVYNGRSSSVVSSPQDIVRPKGVMYDTGKSDGKPCYGASKKMDFELEMGFFVSKPVPYGQTLDINQARDHIFGFVLLNDWSSRDLQAFEMAPLGPFHSKGFGTSISPWIITLDSLLPFACEPKHDHRSETFDHLDWKDHKTGTFDIKLSATLIRNGKSYVITKSNLRYMYWSPYQQAAHHGSAGCGLRTGDLMGTGTISGEEKGELGCLFEATLDGSRPVKLSDTAELKYLEDGDEIILSGWCGEEGGQYIGFGECRGKLLPATGS